MAEELIGIKECRDLRLYIHEFTKGCVLTKSEYLDIMCVLVKAADRQKDQNEINLKN